MENDRLIIGNHKMYMSPTDVINYLAIINKLEVNKNVVICPTSIYLPYFLKQKYAVGVQNIYASEVAAVTGEIAGKQAKEMGVKYAIIGHSERRDKFGETDEIINNKIKEALASGLTVVLCVGEKNRKRKPEKVLKQQIVKALDKIPDLSNIIIAYEPVWAIGTSVLPNNKQITEAVQFVKRTVAIPIRVLYGGSVTDENIVQLNKVENLDGFLVGAASANAQKFSKIIEVVSKK